MTTWPLIFSACLASDQLVYVVPFCRYATDKTSFEVDRGEPVRLAVVACGPRLEETLTMLKSAVLFSHRTLHFHIFAEDELHSGFRDAVSSVLTFLSRCFCGY